MENGTDDWKWNWYLFTEGGPKPTENEMEKVPG